MSDETLDYDDPSLDASTPEAVPAEAEPEIDPTTYRELRAANAGAREARRRLDTAAHIRREVREEAEFDELKTDLMAKASTGDKKAQHLLNRLYGTDEPSLAAKAMEAKMRQQAEAAAPPPTPSITINPFSDGEAMPGDQQLRIIDTFRHAGARNDREASQLVNAWLDRAAVFEKEPARRPTPDACMDELQTAWGPNYEANLRAVNARFDQLFTDPKTNQRLRHAFGTDAAFHKQIFDLVLFEHTHGTADDALTQGDHETREAFTARLHERAKANLHRRGIKNEVLFTIP